MSQDGTAPWKEDWNSVPMWDGKPQVIPHFVTEIKWTLYATKKDERPLLAARVIKKALQHGQSTLVQLMYTAGPRRLQDPGQREPAPGAL